MIYADENVWIPVVEGLRRRGLEVTTAIEADTLGDPDRDQLAHAAANGWVLLTFDDDFLSLVESDAHAGATPVSSTSHNTAGTSGNSFGGSTGVSNATPTATSRTRSSTRDGTS